MRPSGRAVPLARLCSSSRRFRCTEDFGEVPVAHPLGRLSVRRAQQAEREQIAAEFAAVAQLEGVVQSGQLQPPDIATTIRVEDGRTLRTDGPFIEAKEALGGFMVYEADNLDWALELA